MRRAEKAENIIKKILKQIIKAESKYSSHCSSSNNRANVSHRDHFLCRHIKVIINIILFL